MSGQGHVFIAMSLDGRIADEDGSLKWLESLNDAYAERGETPPDRGYGAFMERIGAYLMGRATFDFVFKATEGQPWPIAVPVIALSNRELPTATHASVSVSTRQTI